MKKILIAILAVAAALFFVSFVAFCYFATIDVVEDALRGDWLRAAFKTCVIAAAVLLVTGVSLISYDNFFEKNPKKKG